MNVVVLCKIIKRKSIPNISGLTLHLDKWLYLSINIYLNQICLITKEIVSTIDELQEYIRGGNDSQHKTLREAYGHIPKPQARKIMAYLGRILEDAVRYSDERRPGRRKKRSK